MGGRPNSRVRYRPSAEPGLVTATTAAGCQVSRSALQLAPATARRRAVPGPEPVEVLGGGGHAVSFHVGPPVPGGPGEVPADQRPRLTGIGLPAHRRGQGGRRHRDDQDPGVRGKVQRGEGRGPAGRERLRGGGRQWPRDQRQANQDRPGGHQHPAVADGGGSRSCHIQPVRQQRGRHAVRDDGEPVRQGRADHRDRLKPVPGQRDARVEGPVHQGMPAERQQFEHHQGHRGGPDGRPPPERDRDGGQRHDQRPAEIGQVLRRPALVPGGRRGAARRVEQQVARWGHERGDVVLEEVGQERAAALGQRAEELHPQRVAAQQQRDPGRDPEPGRHGPEPADRSARLPGGEHRDQQHPGDPGEQQQFLRGEQLRRDQQAQPEAGAQCLPRGATPQTPPRAPARLPFPLHGRPPAGRRGWHRLPPPTSPSPSDSASPFTQAQAQQRIDDQRRQDGQLEVVVTDRRVQQGRGEAVDRAGQGGGAEAHLPAPQHVEQAGRGPGEAHGGQQGQGGLRPERQRHRREQHPGQQQEGVPHHVDALRRVHGRGDQRGQAQVRHGGGVVAEEPGEQVGVVRVAGDRA